MDKIFILTGSSARKLKYGQAVNEVFPALYTNVELLLPFLITPFWISTPINIVLQAAPVCLERPSSTDIALEVQATVEATSHAIIEAAIESDRLVK